MNSDNSGRNSPKPACGQETRASRVLDHQQIERVLSHIEHNSDSPRSDELKFLLSLYAGLRAREIAELTIEDMLDASGAISADIMVRQRFAQPGRARVIPMHPKIRDSLIRLREAHPDVAYVAFSSADPSQRQSADAVGAWFRGMYVKAGLKGYSSQVGRYTFATWFARAACDRKLSWEEVLELVGLDRTWATAGSIEQTDNLADLETSAASEEEDSE